MAVQQLSTDTAQSCWVLLSGWHYCTPADHHHTTAYYHRPTTAAIKVNRASMDLSRHSTIKKSIFPAEQNIFYGNHILLISFTNTLLCTTTNNESKNQLQYAAAKVNRASMDLSRHSKLKKKLVFLQLNRIYFMEITEPKGIYQGNQKWKNIFTVQHNIYNTIPHKNHILLSFLHIDDVSISMLHH